MSDIVKDQIGKIKVPFTRKSTQAFIKQVKDASSAEEERSIIATESSKIRNDFGQSQYNNLRENLTKLIFIHLLGYPSYFGQMACLQLISMQSYSDKRIGYLAMDLFLCDNNDLLLLTVNSVKNDIRNINPYISSLALTFCGNRCNEPLARDVFPEIIPIYTSDNPYLRKKACLATIKLISLVPDLLDDMVRSLPTLLNDDDHGVFVSAIQLTVETLKLAPSYIPNFRKLVPRLCKRLRTVIAGNGKSDCFIGSVPDPFVQVHLLQLLSLLADGDDTATDAVIDVVSLITSKVDSTSIAGNAVLYEAVRTILTLNVPTAHLVEAAGILNRFLLNNDADIRYVSLSLLNQMTSIDDTIVNRYRATILSCLRENDPSIRRRALDIIITLVRMNNVEELVRELLQFMTETEDNEERNELITKITSLVQQFAPSSLWQVDTLLAVLRMSGKQNNDEVLPTLVDVVGHDNDILACYTVHRLYDDLKTKNPTEALTQTAIWFIGEYGELLNEEYEDDETVNRNYGKKENNKATPSIHYEPVPTEEVIELLLQLSQNTTLNNDTILLLLTCCLKIASRFDEDYLPSIKEIIDSYQESTDIEIQQRACEFSLMLDEDLEKLDSILDRMPPLDIDTARMLRLENEEQSESTSDDDDHDHDDDDEESTSESESENEENVNQLLDLIDETPANPVEEKPVYNQSSSFIAYQDQIITIEFKTKEGTSKGETIVKAVISNNINIPVNDIELIIIVPRYIQLQTKPISSTSFTSSDETITQLFRLRNNMIDEKDTVVKMRVLYHTDSDDVDETVMVDQFANE